MARVHSFTGGRQSRSLQEDLRPLVGVLLGGLAFGSPVLYLTTGLPLLPFVGITGLIFGLSALVLRRVFIASYVGVVITMTFWADVPLTSGIIHYPGSLGPKIYFFQLPLLVLALCCLSKGWYKPSEISLPQYLFAGFILWVVIGAFVGPTPRPDISLYFALLMIQAWIVFTATLKVVENDILQSKEIVRIFAITAAIHALYGVIQFVNKGPLGLSQLGESGLKVATKVNLGLFGTYPVGGFVSGFAHPGALGIFLLFLGPIGLAMAIDSNGFESRLWLGGFVLSGLVVSMTGSDNYRGAFVLGTLALLLCNGLLKFLSEKRSSPSLLNLNQLHRWSGEVVAVVLTTVFLFFPQQAFGETSRLPATNESDGQSAGSSGQTGGSSGQTAGSSTSSGITDVQDISIPFFDLSNLGIRMQQYVHSLSLFKEHPLFGIGAVNFPFVAGDSLPPLPAGRQHRVHNMYIQLLGETGIVGFFLYIGSIAYVGIIGVRLAIADDSMLYLGVLAGLVGFLGASFWGAVLDLTNFQLPLWMFLGVLVGERYRRVDE